MYERRFYRHSQGNERLVNFVVSHMETDLWIAVDKAHYSKNLEGYIYKKILQLRNQLEDYIKRDPHFYTALEPHKVLSHAPSIARHMAKVSKPAGVGPMASVAGAFAQAIGKAAEKEFNVQEIIVENGGDIYIKALDTITISVFAGRSPLSGHLAIELPGEITPLGICTSSATVGPSLSFGKTDATTIICKDAAAADAYASTFGNMVKSAGDIEAALEKTASIKEILGILIIVGDKIGARGRFKILPV